MSKQSDVKERQGYVEKAIPRQCSTCKYFTSERVMTRKPNHWYPDGLWEDKKMRCGIGGFAVKKRSVCDLHTWQVL